MRIGIHSGPVMAGIVGIRVPRYSLFGNTTTIANQLETHGVAGKIHISDFTLRNLIKRERFVVEDNRSEINGIPFVTYFVTNYLRDPSESREHECLLKEQLIKDLELLGNAELELVDDSQASCPTNSARPQERPVQVPHQRQPQQPHQQQPLSSRTEPPAMLYLHRSPTSGTPHTRRLLPLSDALTSADKTGPAPLTKDLEVSSYKQAGSTGRFTSATKSGASPLSNQLLSYSRQLAGSVLADSMEQVVTRRAGFLAASSVDGTKSSCAKCCSTQPQESTAVHRSTSPQDTNKRSLPNRQLLANLPQRERIFLVSSWILEQIQLNHQEVPPAAPLPNSLELVLARLRSEQAHLKLGSHTRCCEPVASSKTANGSLGLGRLLSSEVQRIKRMDTLKSRRLRRKRQQQQHLQTQLSQQANLSEPAPVSLQLTPSSSAQYKAVIVEEEEEEAAAAAAAASKHSIQQDGPAKPEPPVSSHWGARFHLASPLASLARQLAFSGSPKRQPRHNKPVDYYNASNSRRGCFCLSSSASSQSLGRELRSS